MPATLTSEPSEREIVVDTATVQAVFSNRGGRIVRWRLKEYLDSQGNPVDLVPSGLPAQEPTPFSLVVDDEQVVRETSA